MTTYPFLVHVCHDARNEGEINYYANRRRAVRVVGTSRNDAAEKAVRKLAQYRDLGEFDTLFARTWDDAGRPADHAVSLSFDLRANAREVAA